VDKVETVWRVILLAQLSEDEQKELLHKVTKMLSAGAAVEMIKEWESVDTGERHIQPAIRFIKWHMQHFGSSIPVAKAVWVEAAHLCGF
jgi:hypothetical protein